MVRAPESERAFGWCAPGEAPVARSRVRTGWELRVQSERALGRGARLERAVESEVAIGCCAPGEAPVARSRVRTGWELRVQSERGLGREERMVRAWRSASRAVASTDGMGASVAERAGL